MHSSSIISFNNNISINMGLIRRKILNTSLSTAAIILAAGSSSRMGGGHHKLLLPLDDRPVIAHVIDASLASQAHPIIVVLGYQSDEVRSKIKDYTNQNHITLVENAQYQQGMSSSLRSEERRVGKEWRARIVNL